LGSWGLLRRLHSWALTHLLRPLLLMLLLRLLLLRPLLLRLLLLRLLLLRLLLWLLLSLLLLPLLLLCLLLLRLLLSTLLDFTKQNLSKLDDFSLRLVQLIGSRSGVIVHIPESGKALLVPVLFFLGKKANGTHHLRSIQHRAGVLRSVRTGCLGILTVWPGPHTLARRCIHCHDGVCTLEGS
jgi:hypothetical protein